MTPLIAFTKDWADVPTCTTHILRRIAAEGPVLWVESIGTRHPRAGSVRDLRRIAKRLRLAGRGPRHIENQLWVWSPLFIPRAVSRPALAINRCVLSSVVHRWRKSATQAHFPPPQNAGQAIPADFWCFVPNAVDLLPATGRAIYYCVDDWSKFENLDGAWLEEKERQLLRRADVVFAASRLLEQKCRTIAGKRVHYMPHGVDFESFRAALDASTTVPAFMCDLPHPVIGFYGNLSPWIDFELIKGMAKEKPAWNFVLIGPVYADISDLAALPNVHMPGRVEHDLLPACCKGFDAAIIPYDMQHPRMKSVNPVKARELLAAGVPLVSSDIPEMQAVGPGVIVVQEEKAGMTEKVSHWISALEKQLARNDRHAISAAMAAHDWSLRIKQMQEIIGQ